MKSYEAIKLFHKKECKQLLGRYYINLCMLIGVFLIAILSIGFSEASLAYLQKKMSDPFVTCVEINVNQIDGDYGGLKMFVENTSNQKRFSYHHPEQQYFLQDRFYATNGNKIPLDGLSFDIKSPIDTAILSANNIIHRRIAPIKDTDFGIIISQSALLKLGYHTDVTIIEQYYRNSFGGDGKFAVPILAIVKELPNKCDFFATYSYAMHKMYDESDFFRLNDELYAQKLYILCPDDPTSKEKIEKLSFEEISREDKAVPYFIPWDSNYLIYEFATDLSSAIQLYDSIFIQIQKCDIQYKRAFDFEAYNRFKHQDEITNETWTARKPDLYLCHFEANDSLQYNVEAFQKQLETELNYKLDMSKINNLKNLAYIQQMGQTLSACMVVIAIIFIIVFIYFLLTMHFQKIQRNLGTFKAFGVNNLTLMSIYLTIILEMILFAYILAFVLALIIEIAVNKLIPNEGLYAVITNLNWHNVGLLLMSIIVGLLFTIIVAYRLLRHTPGDLIYNRNQN